MAVYPHYRTIPELIREFDGPAPARRAVANLVGYGLIVLHGNTLLPTPAAYHCHRLDAKWESGDVRLGRFKPDQDATL